MNKQLKETSSYLQLLPLVHAPVDRLIGEDVAEELPVDGVVGGRRPVEVQRRRQGRDLRLHEGWRGCRL